MEKMLRDLRRINGVYADELGQADALHRKAVRECKAKVRAALDQAEESFYERHPELKEEK